MVRMRRIESIGLLALLAVVSCRTALAADGADDGLRTDDKPAVATSGAVAGETEAAPILPGTVTNFTMSRAELNDKNRKEIIERVSKAYIFIGGGSGVVVSADGIILTNDHVAGEKRDWKVRMVDGKSYKAKVLGTDPVSDITMLKMENPPKNLPFLKLGNSDRLEQGQTVIAVGNPFLLGGLDDIPTVTFGIISSLHRFQGGYSDAIMTDVALNPGNSGGPLITLDGEVVGINGRIASRFGVRANSGIGYAIPSNQIQAFFDDFKNAGGFYVFRSQIEGLAPGNLENNLREFRVGRVQADSPAEKAGFKTGDVITHINNHKLGAATQFFGELGNLPPGKTITVTIQRKDDNDKPVTQNLRVTLTKRYLEDNGPPGAVRKTLGLSLPPAPDKDGGEVEHRKSLTVEKIKSGRAADTCGVKVGDILKNLDGSELKTQADFDKAYGPLKIGEKYPLSVIRDGKEVKLTLIPDLMRGGDQ